MKPKKMWRYKDKTSTNECEAHTKAEARAWFKKILGVDRLPVGAKVDQIKTEETSNVG